MVGDSKQSIYRFRQASIATYLDAEQHIGEPTRLTTTSQRQADPDWINTVFGALISCPGARLRPARAPQRLVPAGVTVLGADRRYLPRLPRRRSVRPTRRRDPQALEERWEVLDERETLARR